MIQQVRDVSTVLKKSDLGLDDGVDHVTPVVKTNLEPFGDPYFVLVLKGERHLKNGFRYIKELRIQSHNFKLMQAYDRLAEAGVNVASVKTDCFTIPSDCEQKARELLTFDSGFGSWRVSDTAGILFPTESLSRTQLEHIEIKRQETAQLDVADEWNVNELCDHFEAERRVMVRAEFAGCGKSHACKAMEQRGHRCSSSAPPTNWRRTAARRVQP